MINVLSVISELNFGGGENRLFNLARAIDRTRFRLSVATLYSPNTADTRHCGSMRRQFDDAGIEVYDARLPHPGCRRGPRPVKIAGTAGTLAAAIAKLRHRIVSTHTDLVDTHLETALYTGVAAAASAGVPAASTLYSEVDLWRMQDGGSYRRLFFPSLRRFNLRMCSAIFTDSDARAEDLKRFIGHLPPAVHVIPNGVRLSAPSRPRGEVLAHFGLPAGTGATILGQVAGLVPFKGQTVLIEAARRVLDHGHEVYVLCAGDPRLGPGYPLELRRQAERLGISGRVGISAYPGNIADVWSAIDIHVHASSIDSLPNAIIEGMSLGKPAVVSSVGAIPEHVDDGRTGLVVPPDDPDALETALLRLLGDAGFARRLGEGARQRYLERFTPEVTARQIERCFEQMVEAHRRRAGGQ